MMASRPKQATPRPAPRLYLITPQIADSSAFSIQLASALDAGDIAAVLLRPADADERTLINCAKALAIPVQGKGCALLLDGRPDLVARTGADGAHLTGIAAFADAVGQLKPERIAGAGGVATRHDAMLAAEQGADYVMFGEPDAEDKRPALSAIEERIVWWAEVFEIPCIGYAASLDEIGALVAAGADFVALGDFLWRDPQAIAATIADACRSLRLPEPAA
jgi:thiamine-phosphate pyrophosphorylase